MPVDVSSFFKAYYSAVAEMGFADGNWQASQTSLLSEINGLDPIAANEVVRDKLRALHPDEQLLNLYDAVCYHQSESTGEPYYFDDNNPSVLNAAEAAKRISGATELSLDLLPQLMDATKRAINERTEFNILNRYIAANRDVLNEYRFKKQGEQLARSSQSHQQEETLISFGEFTHTQQAIAIHYLLQEALDVSGVDNTRLMEFAHLLSAKSIPVNKETGKANIRNSGIKSAFNKAWKKEDANHLSDLRFVLRFFKPLNVEGATGIQNAVIALEKRIAKISEKLSREKD